MPTSELPSKGVNRRCAILIYTKEFIPQGLHPVITEQVPDSTSRETPDHPIVYPWYLAYETLSLRETCFKHKMEMQVVLWAKSLPDTIIIGWVPHTALKGHLVLFWDFGQGKCQWMSSLNKQNRNSGCVQCHLRWLRAVYTCPIDTKSCSLLEMNHLNQTWNNQLFNLFKKLLPPTRFGCSAPRHSCPRQVLSHQFKGSSICINKASASLW